MWWHRCDSLKCLLCLWKGLWTNECELLATPAYKRCICVRQRKGPTSGMGDGASAFGMWCLGEKGWGWTNAVSLFGKPDLLVTNRQVYPGTKNANPPLSSRHGSFVFSSGGKSVLIGVQGFPLCICLPVFSSFISVHDHPLSFFFFLFLIFVIRWLMEGGVVLPRRLVFQWPL